MDNPKIEIRDSPVSGSGLFAREAIGAGEEIASFDGAVYRWNDPDEHLPNDPPLFVEDHAIPIGEWEARDSAGFARTANHSCNPNCGITNLVRIVSMRAIDAGEEITWDYDMAQDDGIWDMACRCGSANCRKRIAGYRFLPPRQRERYAGFISQWLLAKPRPFIGTAIETLGEFEGSVPGGRVSDRQHPA